MSSLHRLFFAILVVSVPFAAFAKDGVAEALKALQAGRAQEAVNILTPLARDGDVKAQLQLGLLYYNGNGVEENERLAVDLLKKSASKGNVEAMMHLGNAFAFGHETPRLVADADAEAALWYFKAASAGSADAQYSLALLFMVGKGVAKNDEEAMVWMRKAAKQGHKEAQSYISQ